MAEDPPPDIDGWAQRNGFEPVSEQIAGRTPLLRAGMMDITADAYEGRLCSRRAVLAEFSIGSPGISEAIGGTGTDSTWFTLFILDVEVPGWPRLSVQPASFSDPDWFSRLIRRDHRIHTVNDAFDAVYRVVASTEIAEEQLARFFDSEFTDWCLEQPSMLFDIEDNDEETAAGSLMVAHQGIGIGDQALADLRGRTEKIWQQITQAK